MRSLPGTPEGPGQEIPLFRVPTAPKGRHGEGEGLLSSFPLPRLSAASLESERTDGEEEDVAGNIQGVGRSISSSARHIAVAFGVLPPAQDEEVLRRTFSEKYGIKLEPAELEAAKTPGLKEHVLLYHLIFCMAVLVNVLFIALTSCNVIKGSLNSGAVGIIVLSISVFMRSEIFVKLFYYCIYKTCRGTRPALRLWLSRIPFHAPGALHSGCGLAGFLWECVYAFQYWLLPIKGPGITSIPLGIAASVTCILIIICLAFILVLSIPAIRHRYHNTFELNHRYLGWTLVVATWVHAICAATFLARYDVHGQPLPEADRGRGVTGRQADLWSLALITFVVILPWTFVRRRRVNATVPNPRSCLVLSGFPGHTPAGTAARIATKWWGDWHSFAAVSGPKLGAESRHHSMYIAPAGDWTKARIQEATQLATDSATKDATMQIYVRLIRAPGFMYQTRMWDRTVLVASGAGIAPVLPCVLQRTSPSMFVVWVCNRPESFGEVKKTLEESLPADKLWIHDTAKEGRPDVVALVLKAVKKENADAMFIVANLPLTYTVVRGCQAVGVAAYGAIWDS